MTYFSIIGKKDCHIESVYLFTTNTVDTDVTTSVGERGVVKLVMNLISKVLS